MLNFTFLYTECVCHLSFIWTLVRLVNQILENFFLSLRFDNQLLWWARAPPSWAPERLKSLASSSRLSWSWSWSSYWCSSWCQPGSSQPRSSCSLSMRRVPQATNHIHAHRGPTFPKTLANWYLLHLTEVTLLSLKLFIIHVNHIRLQTENIFATRKKQKTFCMFASWLSLTFNIIIILNQYF